MDPSTSSPIGLVTTSFICTAMRMATTGTGKIKMEPYLKNSTLTCFQLVSQKKIEGIINEALGKADQANYRAIAASSFIVSGLTSPMSFYVTGDALKKFSLKQLGRHTLNDTVFLFALQIGLIVAEKVSFKFSR